MLEVTAGPRAGERLALGDGVVIGRTVDGPGQIAADDLLSRAHVRFGRAPDGHAVVEDLGSTNGTFLNGWRIPAPQYLTPGDLVGFGRTLVMYADDAAPREATRLRQVAPSTIMQTLPVPAASPPARAEPVLQARGVVKSYGDRHVLHGVDLEVEAGEIVGLLGQNGAGKTTFVSIVAGLRRADGGEVRVAGVDVRARPRDVRSLIGIAPQDLGIYASLTVRQNLTFFGELGGLHGADLKRRVDEVGEALSLAERFGQQAATLSGGQKRRLHTGMALLHRPRLVILDEPTVGADVRTRAEILEVVRALAAGGSAVCYSTHYLPEIETLGASVAILQDGRIIARDTLADLIARHASAALELHFDGPAPDLGMPGAERTGNSIRFSTDSPAQVAADALARLGSYGVRLTNIEILRPSLEGVYLALTGSRYAGAEAALAQPQAQTEAHVAAA